MRSRRALLVATLVGFTACEPGEPAPLDVAQAFWDAARTGESERVRTLSSGATTTGLMPGGRARFEDLVLTRPRVRGDVAVVETAMTLEGADGRSLRVTFPTHLVREAGAWKVALDETMTAAMWAAHGSAMADSARSDGDTLLARDTAR